MNCKLIVALLAGVLATIFVTTAAAQEEAMTAGVDSAIESLVDATGDKNGPVRRQAFRALTQIKTDNEKLIERIRRGLTDQDAGTRKDCMRVLRFQSWDDKTKGRLLYSMLTEQNLDIVKEAAKNFRPEYQVGELQKILNLIHSWEDVTDEHRALYFDIVARNKQAFGEIFPVLEFRFDNGSDTVKSQVLTLIGKFGKYGKPALEFLSEQVRSDDVNLRIQAIAAIQDILRDKPANRTDNRHVAYIDGLFKKYDENKDGILDGTELAEIPRSLSLDADADGKVTRSEAIDSLSNALKRMP